MPALNFLLPKGLQQPTLEEALTPPEEPIREDLRIPGAVQPTRREVPIPGTQAAEYPPGMHPFEFGAPSERVKRITKKWREGKGTLAVMNIGDQFYVGEELPSETEMQRVRTAGGRYRPVVSEEHPLTTEYQRPTLGITDEEGVTPTAPKSEAEAFKSLYRQSIMKEFERVNMEREIYNQKMAEINNTINRIVKRGRQLGKSAAEIQAAIQRTSMRERWNMIREPKMGMDFSGVAELFKETTPPKGEDAGVGATAERIYLEAQKQMKPITEEEAYNRALSIHGKARRTPSIPQLLEAGR